MTTIKIRYFLLVLCAIFSLVPIYKASAQGIPPIIRDAEIEETLYRMTAPVFTAAGIGKNDVRLILVEDHDLNAFVAGGMNIFLYTGVILEAENPGELVGVLAHETGHIAGAHLIRTQAVMEQASLQSILATVLAAAAAVGTGDGGAATAVFGGGQTLAQQGFLRHSRTQEASADQAAVKYLSDAGYNAAGLLTFLEKLRLQDVLPSSQQSEYLRTHPLTTNRISYLETNVEKTANKASYSPEMIELFERMQAKLTGYIYPEQALRYPNDTISNRYARAIAHYRKNDLDKALSAADALITDEPNNPYFHELKGQMLFENGRIDAAVPVYAKSVSLAPDSGLIRAHYGQALLAAAQTNADYKNAIEQLERSLRTEPRSTLVHRMLATAYGRINDTGAARVHLAEEALLQRKYADARRQIGLAEQVLQKSDRKWIRLQDMKAYLETIKE